MPPAKYSTPIRLTGAVSISSSAPTTFSTWRRRAATRTVWNGRWPGYAITIATTAPQSIRRRRISNRRLRTRAATNERRRTDCLIICHPSSTIRLRGNQTWEAISHVDRTEIPGLYGHADRGAVDSLCRRAGEDQRISDPAELHRSDAASAPGLGQARGPGLSQRRRDICTVRGAGDLDSPGRQGDRDDGSLGGIVFLVAPGACHRLLGGDPVHPHGYFHARLRDGSRPVHRIDD